MSYSWLRGCGYQPEGAIEVGYETGYWMRKMQRAFPTLNNFFVIEQTPFNDYRLQSLMVPYVKVPPLGRENSKNLTELISSDSSFMEKSPLSIDQILEDLGLSTNSFDLLMLNAKGREYEVLLGANQTLQSVELIHMSAPLLAPLNTIPNEVPNYSFLHIHVLLEQLGFMLFQILHLHPRPNPNDITAPTLYDGFEGIWVRKGSFIWESKCANYPPFSPYPANFQKFLDNFPSLVPVEEVITAVEA